MRAEHAADAVAVVERRRAAVVGLHRRVEDVPLARRRRVRVRQLPAGEPDEVTAAEAGVGSEAGEASHLHGHGVVLRSAGHGGAHDAKAAAGRRRGLAPVRRIVRVGRAGGGAGEGRAGDAAAVQSWSRGLLGEVDDRRRLTAVEVVVGAVGPHDVGRAARIGLDLDEIEQSPIAPGGAGDPELADRAEVVRVLGDLRRGEARVGVGQSAGHRVQALRQVHVPGAIDEPGAAGLLGARAERGRPEPGDVDAAGGARRDPREDVRLQTGDVAGDVDRVAVARGGEVDRGGAVDVAGGIHWGLRPGHVEVPGSVDGDRGEVLPVVDGAVAVGVERGVYDGLASARAA